MTFLVLPLLTEARFRTSRVAVEGSGYTRKQSPPSDGGDGHGLMHHCPEAWDTE